MKLLTKDEYDAASEEEKRYIVIVDILVRPWYFKLIGIINLQLALRLFGHKRSIRREYRRGNVRY